MICPECLEELEIKKEFRPAKDIFKGVETEYTEEVTVCGRCGAVFTDEEQTSRNDISMKDAYKEKMGLLSRAEISDICHSHAVSPATLSRMIGADEYFILDLKDGHRCQEPNMDEAIRREDSVMRVQMTGIETENNEKFCPAKYCLNNNRFGKCSAEHCIYGLEES